MLFWPSSEAGFSFILSQRSFPMHISLQRLGGLQLLNAFNTLLPYPSNDLCLVLIFNTILLHHPSYYRPSSFKEAQCASVFIPLNLCVLFACTELKATVLKHVGSFVICYKTTWELIWPNPFKETWSASEEMQREKLKEEDDEAFWQLTSEKGTWIFPGWLYLGALCPVKIMDCL